MICVREFESISKVSICSAILHILLFMCIRRIEAVSLAYTTLSWWFVTQVRQCNPAYACLPMIQQLDGQFPLELATMQWHWWVLRRAALQHSVCMKVSHIQFATCYFKLHLPQITSLVSLRGSCFESALQQVSNIAQFTKANMRHCEAWVAATPCSCHMQQMSWQLLLAKDTLGKIDSVRPIPRRVSKQLRSHMPTCCIVHDTDA